MIIKDATIISASILSDGTYGIEYLINEVEEDGVCKGFLYYAEKFANDEV